MTTKNILIASILTLVFAIGILFTPQALAIFGQSGATQVGTYRVYSALNATTTTATSTAINVAGAKKVTLFFDRTTNLSAIASSTFSVQVSGDDSTYITYNKLIDNVTNTNAQNLTRVASAILTGTTTKTYSLDLDNDSFLGMKCIVNEVLDGTHTCKVLVEF